MARKKISGVCRICGVEGPLTFEHVPPRAAFNDRPVVLAKAEEVLSLGPEDEFPRGRIQQKGAGAHTLCGRCNNNTGAWYGRHFVDWCWQGMEILAYSRGNPTLFHMHYVFPLSIIKQIIVMFFSANGSEFRARHPELVQFVLDRERRHLSSQYRVFVYFLQSGRPRSTGVAGSFNTRTGRSIILSEIAFPPFGYVMTYSSEPPDHRLLEITHFAGFDYRKFEVLTLQLPALPTHLALPGDYRSREEIFRDYERNRVEEGGGPA